MPLPHRDDTMALRHYLREWLGISDLENQLDRRIRRVYQEMAHNADELVVMFNDATTAVGAKIQELVVLLQQAVDNQGNAEETAAAVQAVVDKFEAPLAQLQALGADAADPVPTPPPDAVPDGTPPVE